MKRSSTCRQRLVRCADCGNTARQTRGWMVKGFLGCPCGGTLEPVEPSDRAFCGLLGPEDVSQADWNDICRTNGWDLMLNAGQHAQAVKRGTARSSILGSSSKPQCSFAGCGRWTVAAAEYCNHHDPSAVEADGIPF